MLHPGCVGYSYTTVDGVHRVSSCVVRWPRVSAKIRDVSNRNYPPGLRPFRKQGKSSMIL